MTKFQIGDTVYIARAGQEQVWVQCPECLGSGRLRVILGDETEVSIACVCCDRGYEGSPGRVQTYKFISDTTEHTLTGISSQLKGDDHEVHYHSGGRSIEEKDVFATREEALTRAATLVAEHEAEEKKRLGYKEKQHKKWAWNVQYWRGEIRRAKETIAHCEARLAVAPKNPRHADKEPTVVMGELTQQENG